MAIPVLELTRDNLKLWRKQFYPIGSGPLGVMRMVVGLIDAIAKDKGWNLTGDEYWLCLCGQKSDTHNTCPRHGRWLP